LSGRWNRGSQRAGTACAWLPRDAPGSTPPPKIAPTSCCSTSAWLGGREIHLPRKEFALLALLARNAGRVLTHATLLRQVWPERQGDDDTQVLRTHVTVLRRKLGLGPLRPRIVSEPGVGYRLVVDD